MSESCTSGRTSTDPTVSWVLLKVIKRKWSEPRWTGPYQVVERTSHTVRLKGKGETWYYWSQCAEAAEPTRSLAEVGKNLQQQALSTDSDGSEKKQKHKNPDLNTRGRIIPWSV